MTWFGWLMIAWSIVAVFVRIAIVGRDPVPNTPEAAAVAVALIGAAIVGILAVGTGHL